MNFDNGSLKASANVKLKVDKKRKRLFATLIDPLTKKVLCDVEYSEGDFTTLASLALRHEYVKAQKNAPVQGSLPMDNNVTRTLIGYVGKKVVSGSFTWTPSKKFLDVFNKSLQHAEREGLYRGTVRIKAKVEHANFDVKRFGDARDCLMFQCGSCLSKVDNPDARQRFGRICELVPHALSGEIETVDSLDMNYSIICPNCANRISHKVEIAVNIPESIADRFRALNFWKNPSAEPDLAKPTPIPNKSKTGQIGIVGAPQK